MSPTYLPTSLAPQPTRPTPRLEPAPDHSPRMISEPTGFDDKATGTAIDQSDMRELPIDTLPTELLEWVISLGATEFQRCGPEVRWICEWRRVSRKWASVIDHGPALWSYVVVENGAGRVPTQLAKSKGAPLIIRLDAYRTSQNEEWIRLLVDNVQRWKSITFHDLFHFKRVSAMLDSPPSKLEALVIHGAVSIPANSKFFNPPSPNLRVLELRQVTIPYNIQTIFGLEELHLFRIRETLEDGTFASLSARKLHQFLQASPGLQVLDLAGDYPASAADKSLQPVDLPNLEKLNVQGHLVLNLFRAEHCASLTVTLESIYQTLPPAARTTVVATLRRAKGLEVVVSTYCLRIVSLDQPPTIALSLYIGLEKEDPGHLSYAILEEILQELENESCISARIQLSISALGGIGLKVLKFLQSPMPGPSSRWRLPHLDTVRIRGEGFPNQYLKAFVQARANAQGDQPPKAITSIFEIDGCG